MNALNFAKHIGIILLNRVRQTIFYRHIYSQNLSFVLGLISNIPSTSNDV